MTDDKTLMQRQYDVVQKDLRINELERDNRYLNIQLKKAKGQEDGLVPHTNSRKIAEELDRLRRLEKNMQDPRLLQKYADKIVNKRIHMKKKDIEDLKKALANYKKMHVRSQKEIEYLKMRIKKVLGKHVYLDLVNSADNPYPDNMILGDAKERFLNA